MGSNNVVVHQITIIQPNLPLWAQSATIAHEQTHWMECTPTHDQNHTIATFCTSNIHMVVEQLVKLWCTYSFGMFILMFLVEIGDTVQMLLELWQRACQDMPKKWTTIGSGLWISIAEIMLWEHPWIWDYNVELGKDLWNVTVSMWFCANLKWGVCLCHRHLVILAQPYQCHPVYMLGMKSGINCGTTTFLEHFDSRFCSRLVTLFSWWCNFGKRTCQVMWNFMNHYW